MKFFFDHDVPAVAARILRSAGFSVTELREVLDPTASDAEVLAHACCQEMILVTCNRDDFLALAARGPHAGIVVLIRRRSRTAEAGALLSLIRRAGESGLASNINFA